MDCFKILGIEPTQDKELIKQVYRSLLPQFHPEDDPEGFQRLRNAFDEAMKYEEKAEELDMTETGIWLRKAEAIYNDFGKRLEISCWEELLEDEVCFSLDTASEANNKLLSFFMNNFYIPHEVWSVLEHHFNWEEERKELYNDFPTDFIDYICANAKYEDNFRYYSFEILPGKDYDRFLSNYFYLLRNIYNEDITDKKQRLDENIALGIEHPDFTILRIRFAMFEENFELAKELCDSLLAVWQDVPSWYSASRLELALKNTEKSREYSEMVLKEIPEHAGAHITIADSWFGDEKYEKALEWYKKASNILPYDSYVNNSIFNTYSVLTKQFKDKLGSGLTDEEKFKYFEYAVKSRNFDDALAINQGFEIPEESKPKYYSLMGTLLSERNEYDKAITQYEKALSYEDYEYRESLYADIGLQHLNMGRYEEAVNKYDEGLTLYKDSIILTYRKASAKIKLGKYEEAVGLCDKILNEKAVPNAYHFKAEALYYLEEYGESLVNCDLAIQIEKYYLTYLLKLKIYDSINQYENLVELAKYLQSVELGTDEVLLLKAKAQLELKNYPDARTDINKMLERNPENNDALYQLAKVYYYDENYKEALENLKKSESGIKDKKSYSTFLTNLYVNLDMYDEAEEVYRKLLESDPSSDFLYYRLGFLFEKNKKYDEALFNYKKALELNPGHYYANGDIADVYLARSEYDMALEYNQKQLEINPTDYYYVQRGNLYGRKLDTENQLINYHKAIEANPNNSFAYNNAGSCYMKLAKYEEALSYFYNSIKLNHPYKEPYLNLDLSLSKLKKYEEAMACLNDGAIKFPKEDIFDLRRGNLLNYQEHYEEAIKYFEAYFESTKDIDYCIKIGRCYSRLKIFDKAIKYYDKARLMDKKNGDPLEEMGDLYYHRKKEYKKAIPYYKKALKLNEKSGYLPLHLGKCYKKLGKNNIAKNYFNLALKNYKEELKSDEVVACDYKNIASAYIELGEYDKAKEYYAEAIEKAPFYKFCRGFGCYDAYFDIGEMYEEQGDYINALENFKKAYEIHEHNVLDIFGNETQKWFKSTLGEPTPVQKEAWPAIAEGSHTLVSAPTGTGKTLSAFLVFIDRLKVKACEGKLKNELNLIYISPLKSLAGDIRENLFKPLNGIDSGENRAISVSIRTGDTTANERRKMIKTPPHILITTPESLYLLLTSISGQGILKTAKAIIVDELHALIDTKRGAHLMLSLARLDKLCPEPLQRIGLSATIDPLDTAAEYLAGSEQNVKIAAPEMQKDIKIEVTSPVKDMHLLPEGTIWPEIAHSVYNHCEGARSVIAFVDGRMYAEKLAFYVNQLAGEGFARTHHGCVSKEQRYQAEMELRSGKLRLLCATSSMELGIDVGDIDRVLQIGCPRSISSVMQRLGRAGHNPGRVSVMHMFPRTASEGLYCGLTSYVAGKKKVERMHPPRLCFDVLAQHLVSMATGDGYHIDDVMDLLPRAYPFKEVTREDIKAILCMLAGDYEHMKDLPVRPRILYDRIHERIEGDAYSRMLAVSAGGTIPDTGMFAVKAQNGVKLGELDEEFVFEARVGDKFLLGSFAWKITKLDKDTVTVTQSTPEGAQPPFWKNIWLSRKLQTGLEFGKMMRELAEAGDEDGMINILRRFGLDEPAAYNTVAFLKRQLDATGVFPDDKTIIAEYFNDEAGDHQLMIHSVFGKQVNAPLALLYQEAAERISGMDVTAFEDDDGILLMARSSRELPARLVQSVQPGSARAVLTAILPSTSLFNMTFRYNAGRALMMGIRKGKRQPLWVQRLRGAEMLDSIIRFEEHPLIRETKRECLEDYWDMDGVEYVLTGIQSGAIQVREVYRETPSPMSLPLRRQAEGTLLYNYYPSTSGISLATDEALSELQMIKPAAEQLAKLSERQRLPEDEKQLHSLLMIEGDLIIGELNLPIEWFEKLAREERAAYIEPGLWIAAEQAEEYTAALEDGDIETRLRIVRRVLRYRGAQYPEQIAGRYFWAEETSASILEMLCERREAIKSDGLYYHADLYERARHETISSRRRQIKTMPSERYAALLASRLKIAAPPAEQLERALKSHIDTTLPLAVWENVILPVRVNSYRPALLDTYLAGGSMFWRITDDGLSFHLYEDIDWDADISDDTQLEGDEQILFNALHKRGASFASSLSSLLSGATAHDALIALTGKGLVHADNFAPVRQLLNMEKINKTTIKQRINARVAATASGRWDLSRPLVEPQLEKLLERAFDKSIILCRETARNLGATWASALETLRIWEYTGRVRRGYFIEGLSGAQFIREKDFTSVISALENLPSEIVWLPASDHLQPWGRVLEHMPERSFINSSGSVVALNAGVPLAVFERQGQTLRIFDDNGIEEALKIFAKEYSQRRVFPTVKRLVLKQYPPEASGMLEEAGFARIAVDFTAKGIIMDIKTLQKEFVNLYGNGDFLSFHSPGRVNLIGEHTDYNGGYVFPCALSFGTYGVARKNVSGEVRMASVNFESKPVIVSLDSVVYDKKYGWANYMLGVINEFQQLGTAISGLDVLIAGNIPNGAGLSSSASIELLMSVIINTLFDCGMPMVEMVKLSQRAENKFVGVNCGIMDQFAVGMGKKDRAIMLNCMNLEYEYVPVELNGYKLVIGNTNCRRGLADSKYNERRGECDKAVEALNSKLNIKLLGDITPEEFEKNKYLITDATVQKRAEHVVYEIQRTRDAVKELKTGNLKKFGELMNGSHDSLKDLYEVTGAELDAMAYAAREQEGVLGSRMTGAGFGGCTVSLVKAEAIFTLRTLAMEQGCSPMRARRNNMKILVCGGAGYIGSHATAELLENGYEVVVADNLEKGHIEAVLEPAVLYIGDLRDPEFLDKVFIENKIDAVIHFAAYSLVAESVREPAKYFDNNINGTLCLLKAMHKYNVNKIVFSSTAATYGEPEKVPIPETAATCPTNPYGETKLAVEKLLKWFDNAYGIKYMALRYFNVAGAHISGRIGEDHSPETHLIPLVLQAALGKTEQIQIFGDDYNTPDGTCIRDYIHVTDLSNAHILALKKLFEEGAESKIYNLGYGHGFSNMEIVEAARRVTGKEIKVKIAARRPGDPSALVAYPEAIMRELGFSPRFDNLDKIIETAWNFHKNNPDGYKQNDENKTIEYEIERLLSFGLNNKLIYEDDVIPTRNALMDLLKISEPYTGKAYYTKETAGEILSNMLDYCAELGFLPENTMTHRDLLEARIMGLIIPRQSEVIKSFYEKYDQSPALATDEFYRISKASNYIQSDRVNKNVYWRTETEYGDLEITINLSKPEKDPRDIAAAKLIPQTNYPRCLLCAENAGYAGNINHPARQNHRIIPVTLNGHKWYFQYSPYVYYQEHCIVLNAEHTPMKITETTFTQLLKFIEKFPHYFIGSNADLPIVGGSILSHDHFQGGRHIFPMEKAMPYKNFTFEKYPDIKISLVKWPMSVIRIEGDSIEELVKLSMYILDSWKEYSDEAAEVMAYTGDTPHNTITPIARRNKKGLYELDLVLRNNRTSEEHPLGIFHPHAELHHIKKENIGLIEVMGLAVLPGRLKDELGDIEKILCSGEAFEENFYTGTEHKLNKHIDWMKDLAMKYGTYNSAEEAAEIIKLETGKVFENVLSDAGVFKHTPDGIKSFIRFIEAIGFIAAGEA
ncbi:atp-dependent helicase lhr-related-related [Holotrichia oblita]|nr:atp-dependent helicase lhr-related-related [Holotrichia oblita]